MTWKGFEELIVWQKARTFTSALYQQTTKWHDFGMRDQLQKAAVSVMSNIAEGYGRNSQKEFAYFIRIARGSCMEVRSLLYVAYDCRYFNPELHQKLSENCHEISRLLHGLHENIRKS